MPPTTPPSQTGDRPASGVDRWIWASGAASVGAAASCCLESEAFPWLFALAAAATAVAAARVGWRRDSTLSTQRAVADAVAVREQERDAAARHAAYWQAIVATMTEGCVTIDARATVEAINDAALRLFGYTRDEVVGQNVRMLMPPAIAAEHDEHLGRYQRTGERRIIGIGREVVGRRKDGSEFPIDLSVGEGSVGGQLFYTAILRNLTERKELQSKVAQNERLAAVGELAAGVAHEVNNPINTIINCAQLIHDGDDPSTNATIIAEEGQRIAEIVRDLLQFARDDRGNAQPTSFADVASRTLRLLGDNWNRHGIKVVVDLAANLPPAMARPQQLQQVLLNLLMNAKDALAQSTKPERTIWLTGHLHDGMVCVSVRDNGPGVPEHLGTRVFEPFVTTKRARGGTGLGLSVSKGIVEGSGGTIELRNMPGEGAEFVVCLPRADVDTAAS